MTAIVGIEDVTPKPEKVWLWRKDDTDTLWKPLRKCDSIKLNQNENESNVTIESGRSTVDKVNKIISYNFYNAKVRQITYATWFQKVYKKADEYILIPLNIQDELIVENLYQNIIKESSSLSKDGFKSLAGNTEKPFIHDSSYKVCFEKVSDSYCLRKRPQSMISLEKPVLLQRGYGEYVVEGEQEEMSLGPVNHLMFVVHGVGEAVWSKTGGSLIDTVDNTRSIVNKKLYDEWQLACRNVKKGQSTPAPPNRVEFIPVEWYDSIHSSTSTLKNTLVSTTLNTIPSLRFIANDIVFDVLMYMTPEFCERVISFVTNQICNFHDAFLKIHDDFLSSGGKFSIIGHSLGSVITWDMLSILQDVNNRKMLCQEEASGTGTRLDPINLSLPHQDFSTPSNYQVYAGGSFDDESKVNSTWGPALKQTMNKSIPFIPTNTIFLGSPLGLFLTLRGAKPLFQEMIPRAPLITDTDEFIIPTSAFHLPSESVYNIFHPSDPIAYRIEPLLVSSSDSNYSKTTTSTTATSTTTDSENVPPPRFLQVKGQGIRFHLKAKELSDNLMKSFTGIFSGKSSTSSDPKRKRDGNSIPIYKFSLGGKSDRVDYQIQTNIVENEYLSAITAHQTYFSNEDVIDFLIQCSR